MILYGKTYKIVCHFFDGSVADLICSSCIQLPRKK